MQKISQRMALVAGGLCLGVSLVLVLVSHLSSRHILEQQRDAHMRALAVQLSRQLAPIVAQNDLIGLEATLRRLLEQNKLHRISVTDLDARPLGQAGEPLTSDSVRVREPLSIDGNLAGEVAIASDEDAALLEQKRMSLGLLFLAVLASLFVAALAGRWGQGISQRLTALLERLSTKMIDEVDEFTALEKAVASLPLDLLLPPEPAPGEAIEFDEAGLLFIHLHSLTRYVETLDERSLLDYTESLRDLFERVAVLYGGRLTVSREFGALMTFSGGSTAGSPGFRAVSAAWLLHRLTAALESQRTLKYRVSLACGLGEAGRHTGARTSGASLYPDLYNQHIIDGLAALAGDAEAGILLSRPIADDPDICNRCEIENGENSLRLVDFDEPRKDLLGRQLQLLLRELGSGA